MNAFNLAAHELTVSEVHRNLPPSSLYEHAIRHDKDVGIAANGALVAYSGAKTGRSPKDKRVVKHPASEKDDWWGPVNIPCDERALLARGESSRPNLGIQVRIGSSRSLTRSSSLKLKPQSSAARTFSSASSSFTLRNSAPSDDAPKLRMGTFNPVLPNGRCCTAEIWRFH
jgi:hypothetical protein